MTAECRPPPGTPDRLTEAEAKSRWDADRSYLRRIEPGWKMPAWSRAPAWRRAPYFNPEFATPPEGEG